MSKSRADKAAEYQPHEQRALKFSQVGYAVVAACSCGWKGKPRDPRQHDGNTAIWVNDWKAHKSEVEQQRQAR